MRKRFLREVCGAGLPEQPPDQPLVTAADLVRLPEPAQRYLKFMRVVGRARDWSFRVGLSGRFRLGPDRPFLPCRTWQYNTRLGIARIFHIKVRFWGLLPVVARDSYVGGHGRMLVKAFDRFTLEDAVGPEFDAGELVTYLNDAIFFAPSMLLGPETTWTSAGDLSFDVALSDRGNSVSARVTIDGEGRPTDFSTDDRFVRDPYRPGHPLIRAHWTTPIRGWEVVGERPVFSAGQAIWQLEQGPFAYADLKLEPGTLAFNVRPGT